MRRVVLALLLGLYAGVAQAADKPVIGPAPVWVTPIASAPAVAADKANGALGFLVLDRQVHFGPEGASEYQQRVLQIRNAMGLAAMGSMALTWNPTTEVLTVHKLIILRDGKSIDVLAKQAFAVLRREAKFDAAVLDGMLTATIQPEGLQVGDVVDLAYTLTRNNPEMQGRSEWSLEAPAAEMDHVRLRATWSAPKVLKWRTTEALGAPKVTHGRGVTEVAVDLRDTKTLTGPSRAPERYAPTRRLEISEFQSWTEISNLLAPLYAKASTLAADSPLRAETAKIRAASTDPKVRAAAALKLVQDKVRYLALVMTDGGLTPIDADTTWTRRFGDCKAKTALLIALLRDLGVEAEPAAVNAAAGDGLDARLPGMSAFDHVLVRAVIGGQVYWLDGTRTGDGGLDSLRVPAFHWALPIRSTNATLEALVIPPLERPDADVLLKVDASGGIDAPAPAHGEMLLRGDGARVVSLGVAVVPAADRDAFLKTMWETAYPWITVKTVSLSVLADTGEVRMAMDGAAKLRWTGANAGGPRWFVVTGSTLGWKADYKREPGPHADAPFAVAGYPSSNAFKFVMALPRNGDGFSTVGPDIDTKVAGRAFHRRSRVEGGMATIEVSSRTLTPEFPASEAEAANRALAEMAKVRVGIRASEGYWPTDKDTAVLMSGSPQTVSDLIDRAERLMKSGKMEAALADLNKAVALEPASAYAVANRGIAYFWSGKYDLAKADFDKAIAMDKRNLVAVHGQGMLAMRTGRYAEAVAAFSRAIDLKDGNPFALSQRASAYWLMRDGDKALADLDELMKIEPGAIEVRVQRFEIYSARNQTDRALKEMDAAIAETPKDARLYLYRGGMLGRIGRRQEAQRDFESALAIQPRADTYLTMSIYRDRTDYPAKLADIAAAERLEPEDLRVVTMRARVLSDQGQHAQAIESLTRASAAHPDNDLLLTERARALIKAGRVPAGLKDLATIRARKPDSIEWLNSLCWTQATLGVALDAALADCSAALAINPNLAAIVDSRAFVLMRMGRNKEALQAYDKAVELRPYQAESLYGRGIVRLRLGMTAEGQADLAAARAARPRIDEDFEDYGVQPGT